MESRIGHSHSHSQLGSSDWWGLDARMDYKIVSKIHQTYFDLTRKWRQTDREVIPNSSLSNPNWWQSDFKPSLKLLQKDPKVTESDSKVTPKWSQTYPKVTPNWYQTNAYWHQSDTKLTLNLYQTDSTVFMDIYGIHAQPKLQIFMFGMPFPIPAFQNSKFAIYIWWSESWALRRAHFTSLEASRSQWFCLWGKCSF